MVAPGVIKRVYEAIYIKVLAADADVLRPQPQSMTQEPRRSTTSCSQGKGSNERSNATNPVRCLDVR